ncbi:hypothetical protein, partial [Pseudomonas syringae group genomosp. 7]|uniref:hypothetical protein n=1 Tax=Pseudomonas syringae group genomosp. 7 TaxID=251699 RepID=UPI0037705677
MFLFCFFVGCVCCVFVCVCVDLGVIVVVFGVFGLGWVFGVEGVVGCVGWWVVGVVGGWVVVCVGWFGVLGVVVVVGVFVFRGFNFFVGWKGAGVNWVILPPGTHQVAGTGRQRYP